MSSDSVQLVADPYPPYQFVEAGNVRGADHDLIAAAFREQDITSVTTLCPWDECLRRVDAGEADGIFQIQWSPERGAAYVFSEPLRTAQTVAFARTEQGIRFEAGEDIARMLGNYRLGTVRGYASEPPFVDMPDACKVTVDRLEDLVLGLSRGDFDLAVMDLGVGNFLARKLGVTNVERVPGFESTRVLYTAFRRDAGELAARFNAGLERARRAGIEAAVLREYGITE